MGFVQNDADSCVFAQTTENSLTITIQFMWIILSSNTRMMEVKKCLETRFKMKQLDRIRYCFGIFIDYDQDKKCKLLYQKHYTFYAREVWLSASEGS